jgi:hypothetical protein
MARFGSASGLGSSSPGNGGGRDGAFEAALMQERRHAQLEEARRRQANAPKASPHPANLLPQYVPPATIFDQVPGLPYYGVSGPTYAAPMPTPRKAGGYGGVARPFPIQYRNPNS